MRKMSEDSIMEQSIYDMTSLESLGCHMFFGDVDIDSSFAACEFILKSNLLRSAQDPLTIFINTAGGETSDGFSVIDLMETSHLPIATVGVGLIASMGVLLLSAGTKGMRTLTKNAEIMAHQFSGYFGGKQHELIATQTAYKLLEDRIIGHFLVHSNMSQKQIRDVLFAPSDRYLTPAECKKFGLVDNIVSQFDTPSKPVKRPRADLRALPL
jgi:ATP-dependent Clp protease protease subunit